jgi:hypothetical protein
MADKDLARQVEALTHNVARLTGLILEMHKLMEIYNGKLERIVKLIEEAEHSDYEWGKHDLH